MPATLLDERPVRTAHRHDVRHQAATDVRRALGDIRGVVLERDDAVGLLQGERGAEGRVEQVRAHAGVVLVDEAPVGTNERAFAGLRIRRCELGRERMAGDDLLEQGARCRRQRFPGSGPHIAHPALAEAQQAAALQDRRRERVAPLYQLVDRDRLACFDAVDETEIGRGEQADVVCVLAVDALEALGDDEADAGEPLGRGAVLARRALAVALAGHRHREAAGADGIDADRSRAIDAEARVRVAAELVVVVGEDRNRRDLVGRDVIAQCADFGARQPTSGELISDRRFAGREIEDPAGQRERFHGDPSKHTRWQRTAGR
jgi:hypothetical protein